MTSDDRRYIVAFPLADLKKLLTSSILSIFDVLC